MAGWELGLGVYLAVQVCLYCIQLCFASGVLAAAAGRLDGVIW
jgi:hypothetical protein